MQIDKAAQRMPFILVVLTAIVAARPVQAATTTIVYDPVVAPIAFGAGALVSAFRVRPTRDGPMRN
jgi:hypothetical protein